MKAIGFALENVINPETGAESSRIVAKFDNSTKLRIFIPQDFAKTPAEAVTKIKADRNNYLKKVVVLEGEYGPYAMFSAAETVEEF